MYLAKIRSYFDSVGTLSKDERYARMSVMVKHVLTADAIAVVTQ